MAENSAGGVFTPNAPTSTGSSNDPAKGGVFTGPSSGGVFNTGGSGTGGGSSTDERWSGLETDLTSQVFLRATFAALTALNDEIALRASEDTALGVRIDTNTGLITVNTASIMTNATAIATKQDRLVAGTNITIVDNGDDTATITAAGGVSADVAWDGTEANLGSRTFLDNNYAALSALLSEVTTRTTQVADLAARVTSNETNITTNADDISQLTGRILTDENALTAEIARAEAAELVNRTGIATNVSGIAGNAASITTNANGIVNNGIAIGLRQVQLTAGTNIMITSNTTGGDTISATGGSGPGATFELELLFNIVTTMDQFMPTIVRSTATVAATEVTAVLSNNSVRITGPATATEIPSNVRCEVNGVDFVLGSDYTVGGGVLTFTDFSLLPNDNDFIKIYL